MLWQPMACDVSGINAWKPEPERVAANGIVAGAPVNSVAVVNFLIIKYRHYVGIIFKR